MTAIKDTPEVTDIKALIAAFFDQINANSPKGLQKLFVPNANLTIIKQDPPRNPPSSSPCSSLPLPPPSHHTTAEDEKLEVVIRISIEGFVKMVEDGEKKRKGKPGPKVHEVPDLNATDVKIDGLFGTAWSPFRVTFDGVLHHYGVFNYTFGKVDGEWKIEGLTQSYRRTTGWEEESEFGKSKSSL